MADLRLSEHYVSAQGEGPRTGEITQFVRFAGCNMRCPGWPCDTQHAINPAIFLKDSTKPAPYDLLHSVQQMAGRNICLTGGEPFLQPEIYLQEFVELLVAEGYSIECFTNGSFEFPTWALQSMSFMMDWKLAGSGEGDTDVEARTLNALRLRRSDGIKFVIKDEGDLDEAVEKYVDLKYRGCTAQFWVGIAWGCTFIESDIVNFLIELDLPWKLNVQVHKYLWDPEERSV